MGNKTKLFLSVVAVLTVLGVNFVLSLSGAALALETDHLSATGAL